MRPDPASNLEPARLAVIFPGQRADHGGGELADTLRRASQLRTLFPRAQIDLVVFDPPQTLSRMPLEAIDRPRRVADYIHRQLGWSEPWDYRNHPVIERPVDGANMRFVYATAPAEGPFRESYAFRAIGGEPMVQGGVEVRAGQPLNGALPAAMYPSPDSLGARSVAAADIAFMAGASGRSDGRAWHLDTPGSPQARVNVVLHEPDLEFNEVADNPRIHTTLSDRSDGRVSDLTATDINHMRGLVDTTATAAPSAHRFCSSSVSTQALRHVSREQSGQRRTPTSTNGTTPTRS